MKAHARLHGWLILVALLVCGLVNPGNFGTIDTTWRLQVARSIRLGEPEVNATSGFGIMGRDGKRHAWFGIGQALVLLPFDTLVSAIVPSSILRGLSRDKQEQLADLLIAFLMQFVLTAVVLILALQILLSFGFTPFVSAAGVLSLLFATSCLAYVQMAQENELLLALDLCALWAVRRWDRDGGWWPMLAGAACGFAILTRLPSVLESAVFALLAASSNRSWKRFLSRYLPPVFLALAIDRYYQWIRFGRLFSTYIGVYGSQFRPQGAPLSYPFSYPFWKGFLGAFLSSDKSVLLFDPLLLVLALVVVWRWRDMDRALRITLLALLALLLGYAAGYAKYYDFGGDAAWGDRFLTVPVQLLALFAVPLLAAHGKILPALARRVAWALVPAAVALQFASTAIAPNLEIMQRNAGYGRGVVWNRCTQFGGTRVRNRQ